LPDTATGRIRRLSASRLAALRSALSLPDAG